MEYRQYIIIPKQPKMSAGKIASQAVHASFMALEKQKYNITKKDDNTITTINGNGTRIVNEWKDEGQTVIVLECKNQLQLMSAAKYLEQWSVPHHLYIDEGMTEVDPLTPTALATGVMHKYSWWMLKQFKLYGAKR